MLTLRDVRKEYGEGESAVVALKGVTVSFRENEFVSILGPSGCGKTTLLNIIGGLDHYTSGDLVIRGVSTKLYRDADWDAYRNHSVGFVFQNYNLIPHQTVLSNVELALTLSGVSKAERRERATEALMRVGLGDQIKKRPNQLSGGQMQRVAIARALVNDPDVLLADEPTGALDTETSIQVMDLLREVAREKLVVMVTHNPDLAERYSTRIIRLLDGGIVGDTDPYEPAEEPAPEKPTEAPVEETPAEPAAEESTIAKEKTKPKKRSMSLLTALSLSLNNLMTKKGRTFLTSFAGSIGIIGIALILALSNGINLYINRVQEDSLSSYPITINREEADLLSMITSLSNLRSNENEHETDDGNVYGHPVFENLIGTLFSPDITENNLTAFKRFIDDGAFDGVDATVQYGYDIPLTVYTRDSATGDYVSTDIYALMSSVSGTATDATATSGYSFSSSFSSYSVWSEVIGGKDGELVADLVKEQYDLLAGEWPTGAGDVLVVVNDNDEVNDLVLFALGLRSKSEMTEILTDAVTGGGNSKKRDKETAPAEKWSYDEILGRTFRTVAPANLYKPVDGKWQNMSGDQTTVNATLSDDNLSLEMRVCGILRRNPDASASEESVLFYTRDLTSYLVTSTLESEIVRTQMENPEINVLTGKPYPQNISDAAGKEEAFRDYVAGLTDAEKAAFLRELLTTDYDPATDTVSSMEMRVLLAVRDLGASIGTERDEIIGWVNANCPEYAGLVSGIQDKSKLKTIVTEMLALKILQTMQDEGERLYEQYRNEPAESEVDARKAEIIGDAATPDEIRGAKEGFLVSYNLETTEVSEDALTAWAAGLSDEELDGVFDRLVRAKIKSEPIGEDVKDRRCAAVLDGLVSGWNRTNAASAYTYFILKGSAGSSYEETLAKLYVYNEDSPSRISIYVSTFAQKDKVTDIIAQYNESVAEEDQITYTDIMALLMTSVTLILNAVTYVLVAFVSVSLVVSSIMIGIITYISVLERTKEIGILRAIGASKRDVSRVFNAETLIIGFAAGLIGIIVTLLFCIPINLILRALSGISNIAAVLPVGGGIALVLISMGLTLLAGLIPARMASKKDPVVALRTE